MYPLQKRRNPYLDKILRHSPSNPQQLRTFFLITFLYAFALSYDDWGVTAFSLVTGIGNLILSFFVVLLSYGAHQLVQKWYATHRGYKPEHLAWTPGILLGLVLLVLSNGNILLFAGSGVFIHHLTVQRLGTFRYGVNVHILGKIALLGLIMTALLAALTKMLLLAINLAPLPEYVLTKMYTFNLLYLFWNALPIPPLDGSRIFYWSRMNYVFWSTGIFSYLLLLSQGFQSLLAASLIAVGATGIFYYFFERHWWNPANVKL